MNDATLREVERVGCEYPDGVHTCAELQQSEPGRRSCTCGRCGKAPVELIAEALKVEVYRDNGQGMYVPTNDVSVRITHVPTGESAIGVAKSALRAKKEALDALREKLGVDTAPKSYKGVPVPETFKNHPNRWDNDFDMLESLPGHWWRKGVDDHIAAMLLGREGNHPVTGIAYND